MGYEEKNRKSARSEADDLSSDQELKSILQHWSAPSVPASLDNRMLASYRGQVSHRRRWRLMSFWPASLPGRLAAAASLCVLAFVIFYYGKGRNGPTTPAALESPAVAETYVEISGTRVQYSTYIHLSGLQPAQPVRVQIVRGSDDNEN